MPTDICFLFLLKSVSWLKVPTYLLPFSEIISNGFAVFVLITVGMRPYRYLTGFPKAKDKEITLLPIFCYQSAKKIPAGFGREYQCTNQESTPILYIKVSLMNTSTRIQWIADWIYYKGRKPCLGFSPNDSSIITVVMSCTCALNAIRLLRNHLNILSIICQYPDYE